jgi:hypothetical protein
MKKKILIILLLIMGLAVVDFIFDGPVHGYLINFGSNQFLTKEVVKIEIADLNEAIVDSVEVTVPEKSWVYKLTIVATGELSDTVVFNDVRLLPGKIDTVIYNGDWYHAGAVYRYEPPNNIVGRLEIKFVFYCN